jgi:hypothetical protein
MSWGSCRLPSKGDIQVEQKRDDITAYVLNRREVDFRLYSDFTKTKRGIRQGEKRVEEVVDKMGIDSCRGIVYTDDTSSTW